MKKLFFTLVMILFVVAGKAQQQGQTVSPTPESEWLQTFTSIEIEAPIDIVFVRVPETQAPKIVYDTKGSYTTKFRYEVKDRVLRITERSDARRPKRTSVTLYYNTLRGISVLDAVVTVQDTISTVLLDLNIGGTAHFTAPLQVKDLKMNLSGHSKATLSGQVRYMNLVASTGTIEAADMEVMAAYVEAKSSAQLSLNVTERLEATTSTKGSILFKGAPDIVRGDVRFMGGNIGQIFE